MTLTLAPLLDPADLCVAFRKITMSLLRFITFRFRWLGFMTLLYFFAVLRSYLIPLFLFQNRYRYVRSVSGSYCLSIPCVSLHTHVITSLHCFKVTSSGPQ